MSVQELRLLARAPACGIIHFLIFTIALCADEACLASRGDGTFDHITLKCCQMGQKSHAFDRETSFENLKQILIRPIIKNSTNIDLAISVISHCCPTYLNPL